MEATREAGVAFCLYLSWCGEYIIFQEKGRYYVVLPFVVVRCDSAG